MMHLVFDVGNTDCAVGLFHPGSLEVRADWRYSTMLPRTPDELLILLRSFLREGGVDPAAILRSVVGSVVPAHSELLRRTLPRLGQGELYFLEGPAHLPLRLDVEEPRSVGADRIANTLAAATLLGRDTIVVDLGTATTYDCITGDGVFVGGVIAPGIMAGQEWLAGHTAKLPRVEFQPPDRVIGRRTESCLHSGIFYGSLDSVDAMVDRIVQEWGREGVEVVATGGFAPLLAPFSRTLRRVEPHLTLVGLELAGAALSAAER